MKTIDEILVAAVTAGDMTEVEHQAVVCILAEGSGSIEARRLDVAASRNPEWMMQWQQQRAYDDILGACLFDRPMPEDHEKPKEPEEE